MIVYCFFPLSYCSNDKDSSEVSADDFFTGQGSPAAVHRLIAGELLCDSYYNVRTLYVHTLSSHNVVFFCSIDLKSLNKSSSKFGISGSPRDVSFQFIHKNSYL